MPKVKEEPGTTTGEAMTTTADKNDPEVRPKSTTTMLPKPAPIAALPQPTAAAATAMASMFAGFPGGFNAAAFAKAAAAAFPGGLPKLAAAPPAAMSSPAFGAATTNAGSTSKPATKRRKRGRAAEEEHAETPTGADSVKPEGYAGGTAMAAAAGGNSKVAAGGPLATKLAEQPAAGVAISPQPGGVGGAGAAGASAAGAWTPPAAGGAGAATINVLTPNLFNGDMSNQERKVCHFQPSLSHSRNGPK